jgi:molybdopterin/thiamine biosynthesis adenylyltransferase
MNEGREVLVVGAGTIGSHLLRHLARLPEIEAITVVDRERYEEKNLLSQDISFADCGKPKAHVQKRLLRRVRENLRIRSIVDDVENVPLGQLTGHAVVLSAVDSRAARQAINRIAFRLGGVPWIDAGIEAGGLLARVHVYRPGSESPCLECSWSQADYAVLEQAYPCQPAPRASAPSAASPSCLGALAAALQAIETLKLLQGRWDEAAIGRQVLIDARTHKHYVTRFPRNAGCRFDHSVWRTEPVDCGPHELTLGQAFEMGRGDAGPSEPLSMRVEPRRFVQGVSCTACGAEWPVLCLGVSPRMNRLSCDNCGALVTAPAFSKRTRVDREALPKTALALTLGDLGLRNGDVYTISSPNGERHFAIR